MAWARQAEWENGGGGSSSHGGSHGPGGHDALRRLLIVLSDGSPMDGATHQANERHDKESR